MATRTKKADESVSARKVFTTKAQKSGQDSVPVEFEIYDEVFQAKPRLQAIEIVNFLKKNNDEASLVESFDDVILPFFKASLYAESFERFENLIRSDDKIMEVEDIVSVLQWLIEQYTNRPTDGSQK